MSNFKNYYEKLKNIIISTKFSNIRMIMIVFLVISSFFVMIVFTLYNSYQTKFYSNIELSGINLQGKDYNESQELLDESLSKLHSGTVVLEYQDISKEYYIDDFNVNWKIGNSLEKAKRYDELSILEFMRSSLLGTDTSTQIELKNDYAGEIPEWIVSEWDENIAEDPVNAEYQIDKESQNVEIIPHEYGRKIDEDKLNREFEELVVSMSNNIDKFLDEDEDIYANINVTAHVVKPELVEKDLHQYNVETLVSTYQTEFNPDNEGRATNIRLATEELDGYLIKPGDRIEFNEVIGPRTAERGYEEAPVLVQGEYVDGLGGGICQVSSTLYNSAVKAGMEVIQRFPHGRPVSYVPIGRDATVAYDYLDLVLENETDDALLLSTVMENGSISVDIYGSTSLKKINYQFLSKNYQELSPETDYYWKNDRGEFRKLSERELDELLDKEDNLKEKYEDNLQLEIRENGRTGYQIDIYIIKSKEGEELARELLYRDTYASSPKEIVIKE